MTFRKPKPHGPKPLFVNPKRETVSHAFDNVMADMIAGRHVTFPPGHCWPPAADGDPTWPIVVTEAGEWIRLEPERQIGDKSPRFGDKSLALTGDKSS